MSRFSIIVSSCVVSGALLTTGCKPNRGTASPEDYFSLIQIALQGGEIAAMIGRNEAIKDQNFAGCVASEVLIGAFDSAGDALSARVVDEVIIPGFEVDLQDCLALKTVEADSASESEAPTTEMVEGHEVTLPVVVEVDPGATPASQKDAAVWVEAIAGVAITAGVHYATKLRASDCVKGEIALAALGYLQGMVKPIADEIENTDGIFEVPPVTVSLGSCTEG